MRAIIYLTTCGIIYLLGAFLAPPDWTIPIQLFWLFAIALPLWFPPMKRWIYK